jgi:choice-of-anchor A domain-containing protein
MKHQRLIAFVSAIGLVSSTHAQTFGVASSFNDFILGNATQSNVDALGLYAVGGNANFTNLTINSNHDSLYSGYGAIVGGTYSNIYATVNGGVFGFGGVTATDPTINGNVGSDGNVLLSSFGTVNGSIVYGGTYTNPNTTVTGSATHGSPADPIDFAAAATYLKNLSTTWAAITSNGTTSLSGSTLTLTGSSSSLDVFTVTAAQLAASNDLEITAPTTASVIVNVLGSAESLSGGLTLHGIAEDHVIYNFSQATSLSFSGISILGSVLAPNAAMSFSTGNIYGNLIVGSATGSFESHDDLFNGNSPPSTPEPISMLVLPGALVTLWARRRKPTA